MKTLDVPDRAALVAVLPALVEAARAQRARYAARLEMDARVERVGAAIAAGLGPIVDGKVSWYAYGVTSHGSNRKASIRVDDRELVRVWVDGERVMVHAGLAGGDGWEGELADASAVAAALGEIGAALARERRTLTIDRLVLGRRYRVRESLQGLVRGETVVFRGFDDVDNHYGRYEFAGADGRPLAVGGDFSTPSTSPLGETHRYLEPIEE